MKKILFLALCLWGVAASAVVVKIENQTEAVIKTSVVVLDTNQNFIKDLGTIDVDSYQTFSQDLGAAAATERFLFRWSVIGANGLPLCYEGQFPAYGNETFAIRVSGTQEHNIINCAAGRF